MPLKMLIASALGFAASMVPPRLPRPTVVVAGVDDVAMQPAPIDPSWVLSGDPQARSGLHSHGDDRSASTHVWDCTAGSFRWQFGWDETVIILSGGVRVTAEDGSVRELAVGDVAYFTAGSSAVWEIDHHVRKLAFIRRPMPGPLAAAIRMKSYVREMVSLSRAA